MEHMPNTIGCVGNSLAVASSSQCPQDPCPFCHLNLRHDCSEKDILHRCRDFTGNTRFQLRTLVGQYVSFSVAARSILSDMGSTAKLPVAMSLQDLLGAERSVNFCEAMVWVADPPGPPPGRGGHPTVGTTVTGSGRISRGTKRYMDADEYPQWQFKSGQKKNRWTAYDRDSSEQLEEAHSRGERTVHLEIDGWCYVVYLGNFSQLSLETNSRRDVRRLTAPPVCLSDPS